MAGENTAEFEDELIRRGGSCKGACVRRDVGGSDLRGKAEHPGKGVSPLGQYAFRRGTDMYVPKQERDVRSKGERDMRSEGRPTPEH